MAVKPGSRVKFEVKLYATVRTVQYSDNVCET